MKKLQVLTYTFLTIFFIKCTKTPKCELPLNVNQSEVVVTFKDATGKYLYPELNPLYNKDTLKVFDPTGNSLVILKVMRINTSTLVEYWDLSFGNIYNQQTDGAAFNTEICKEFVIKYKFNETDTVKTCFKATKTECGSVFETLKVYHKGQLLGTNTNKTSIVVTIIKN